MVILPHVRVMIIFEDVILPLWNHLFCVTLDMLISKLLWFKDWNYFSGRHKLLTILNRKGPFYDEQCEFYFKAVFDSLKEAS